MKVLVVEDNESLLRNIVRFLNLKDIETVSCSNWIDALEKWLKHQLDAIILDINLPWMDWLEVCKTLREKWKDIPIIMLTSRSLKSDIIAWLENWADDYLVKPFDYEELVARLKSLSRRNLKNKSNIINIWPYTIDLLNSELKKKNKIIPLSELEFSIYSYLAQNKGRVVSKKEIFEKIWKKTDEKYISESKLLEVYISYIRKKMGKDYIKTRKGFWYLVN